MSIEARHISEEARILLTTLRTGPPHVAHGPLVQNLVNLRLAIKQESKKESYAQPFLNVILNPRAAGPHTLIALRCLYRLLDRKSLILSCQNQGISTEMTNLMRGILACRFEQTDVGNDEAVEMAIADILSLLISLDDKREMDPNVIMEGFNTVFVTRNTFVHSPALCYHFEEVLGTFVNHLFESIHVGKSATCCRMILNFLVGQLLHTPMNVEDGNMNGSEIMAHALHDATRILSLKLIQSCVRMAWGTCVHENENEHDKQVAKIVLVGEELEHILKIIKDDLCLSLLMVGQGIWAYQDPSSSAVPGMISIQVLTEICSTLSTLWNLAPLRTILKVQFESIFTGFYQRALALLRRLPIPVDSGTFNSNQIFDAEVEIILESLVDIIYLHENGEDNNGLGALETLFITYDCDLKRSDVASGLFVELSRCCGGTVDESGQTMRYQPVAGMSRMNSVNSSTPETPSRNLSKGTFDTASFSSGVDVLEEIELRHVPAHLRELCAEALLGTMKSIFTCSASQLHEAPNEKIKYMEKSKEKKQLMREATILFNAKPTTCFNFLLEHEILVEPVTPTNVAEFLRNGIVLGLEKPKVGEYLGTVGKSPVAGKSPPDWERDWFHKETLKEYCAAFNFKEQSLLECLRMFLSSFRLPGEAQQIDRILQAFSESCASQCKESKEVFSPDSKKAADAAYLLSFSIIMLNTDLHNDNIRMDRKMKLEDFVKNNTDYGRDIMDPEYTFPQEFLEVIYQSIRDEQIRTMGEGADGVMTTDRWKDVLRGDNDAPLVLPSACSYGIKKLIVNNVWMPILSAIRGFWSVPSEEFYGRGVYNKSGMLGSQGARLGMDLSMVLLRGLRNLSRLDIFQDLFTRLCFCTGLIGGYEHDAVQRTSAFVSSVERQSAVVVAIKVATECGDLIGLEGWKCIWSMLFELRDLKLIASSNINSHRSLLQESDPDLLRPDVRRDWEMRIVKECYEATGGSSHNETNTAPKSSFLGSLIFGSPTSHASRPPNMESPTSSYEDAPLLVQTDHGKEEMVLWDDLAPSDTEGGSENGELDPPDIIISLGDEFEKLLVKENQKAQEGPVTGLETYEDTRVYQMSPRARVRRRLSSICDFSSVLSETRFLDIDDLNVLLQALVNTINGSKIKFGLIDVPIFLSPGSEALGEVWLCEITLKNRDRTGKLWNAFLKDHYTMKLRREINPLLEPPISAVPGVEKCVTGLLRICYNNVHRKDSNNDILQSLECLYGAKGAVQSLSTPTLNLNKHIAEGMWRICRDVDGLRLIDNIGWDGLLGLIHHCAGSGEVVYKCEEEKSGTLADDDPALQAFRCIHLMLRSNELRDVVPFSVVNCINTLIKGGEQSNCPKLSIAGLDLLSLLHARLQALISSSPETKDVDPKFMAKCWIYIVEGMAEASNSQYPSTRQHSIAMFTDSLVDRHGQEIHIDELCMLLNTICLPMAGSRITELIQHQVKLKFDREEILIEMEQCISAIFKPFLHYLKRLTANPEHLSTIWMSILELMTDLLKQESIVGAAEHSNPKLSPSHLLDATKQLATEHLRNVTVILMSKGIVSHEAEGGNDISSMTWSAIENIPYIKAHITEWRESGTIKTEA